MLQIQPHVLPSQWSWLQIWVTPMGRPRGQQSLQERPLLLSHWFQHLAPALRVQRWGSLHHFLGGRHTMPTFGGDDSGCTGPGLGAQHHPHPQLLQEEKGDETRL